MQKEAIRREILEKRKLLKKEEVIEKGNLAMQKLFSTAEYKNAKDVMFFVSFGKELYTHDGIRQALEEKRVVVPKIVEFEIVPCRLNDFRELEEGKYRIMEPAEAEQADKIDIVLVPGIAFNKKGYRVGYGKGYYDSFLKDRDVMKIGLCMDFQIVDKIDRKEWDVPMDIVISENQVIRV